MKDLQKPQKVVQFKRHANSSFRCFLYVTSFDTHSIFSKWSILQMWKVAYRSLVTSSVLRSWDLDSSNGSLSLPQHHLFGDSHRQSSRELEAGILWWGTKQRGWDEPSGVSPTENAGWAWELKPGIPTALPASNHSPKRAVPAVPQEKAGWEDLSKSKSLWQI